MRTVKFKSSEVGPIPVEWEVKRLGDVGYVVTGSTPPRDDMECWGGNYNWISAKDFKDKYIVDSEEKVTTKGKAFCRLLPSDSVLVTCIASIGLNAIAKNPCATNQQINAVICKACDNEFLYYQIEAAKGRMMEMAGQTAVPIINKGDFENLLVSLPSLTEQRKIAETLSDVDALLSAMTTLIEKKRAIKQGAMQQLLTGKKRLAGFTGPWVEKRLGGIADFSAATTPVATIDLKWYIGTENMLADKAGVVQNSVAVPYKVVREYVRGDVLTSNIRPYLKKIWLADRRGGCSTDVLVIRTHDNSVCIPEFLLMLISDDAFFDFAMANAVGTKMPRGDKKVLVNFEVKLPTIVEQQAIAAVLSDMDAEIAALEAKRAKYESIKQGMMQELLTGKTRLV